MHEELWRQSALLFEDCKTTLDDLASLLIEFRQ